MFQQYQMKSCSLSMGIRNSLVTFIIIALSAECSEEKLDCKWVEKWMGGAEVDKESQGHSFENSGVEMEDSNFEVAERKKGLC